MRFSTRACRIKGQRSKDQQFVQANLRHQGTSKCPVPGRPVPGRPPQRTSECPVPGRAASPVVLSPVVPPVVVLSPVCRVPVPGRAAVPGRRPGRVCPRSCHPVPGRAASPVVPSPVVPVPGRPAVPGRPCPRSSARSSRSCSPMSVSTANRGRSSSPANKLRGDVEHARIKTNSCNALMKGCLKKLYLSEFG